MLLTELVELLAAHFNIISDDITTILKNNNLRINQRLLLEKNTQNNNEKVANYENRPNLTNNDKKKVPEKVPEKIVIENNTNKETKPVRGRGRPKKNTIMKDGSTSEEEICVEVEEVEVDGVKYYKTNENVILSKSLEIEGIMRGGKLIKNKKP